MFFAQDANGDSDLWDLAIIEGGEAVRRPTSTSPFASKALLTCFNSDVSMPTSAMHDSNALLCASPMLYLHAICLHDMARRHQAYGLLTCWRMRSSTCSSVKPAAT